MGMSLVQSITVGAGGAANIEFTSIPQTGTHLLIALSSRNSIAGYAVTMSFNGSTATNYAVQVLYGDGANGKYAQRLTTQPSLELGASSGGTDTANIFGMHEIIIYDYTSSQTKSISVNSVSETNTSANAYQTFVAGEWLLTDAISSILLKPGGTATFAQYTSASLYRINTL